MILSVSIGEAIDKYTILQIKSERIKDDLKLKNINKERLIIEDELCAHDYFLKFHNEINELKEINEQLWDIEDKIRIKESKKEFDEEFINLARSVYITNDKRFEIKNKINQISNSNFKEEKSYEKYN
jgi:hypothetical protein